MSEVFVKEKDIVIPGEELAEGMDYLPGDNTYREKEKLYSKVLGLIGLSGRVIKVTPLSGPYVPRYGDKLICRVIDIGINGWRVETSTAYSAMLNVRDASNRFIKKEEDLSKIIAIDDYIIVKIRNVTSQNLIDLTMKEPGLFKIIGGRIIKINSQKVPRVIGKKGSMISLVKEKTHCDVTVGQNGMVWIKGTPEGEIVAEKAIQLIEKKSHIEGLTDEIEKYLDKEAAHLPKMEPKVEETRDMEEDEE
jgi:exosome complex component RRP4